MEKTGCPALSFTNFDSHCCPAKCRTVYSWIFTILPAIQNKIVYLALFEAKFVWLKVKF